MKIHNKLVAFSFIALSSSIYLKAAMEVLAEGKTKIIYAMEDPSRVLIESKDDITAGDGARRNIIDGKGAVATRTTCNVFRLLKASGIPVAFDEEIDPTRFVAPKCKMIELEVVCRRMGMGSYLRRNPATPDKQIFPKLIVEFFLKTNDQNWKGIAIPKDDPFMIFKDGKAELYLPDQPMTSQKPFMVLDDYPCKDKPELYEKMANIARQTFLVLEKAWQMAGGKLVDFKVEFGFDTEGNLLLADVVDNDSWRVIYNKQNIDKQYYRDSHNVDSQILNEVMKRYLIARDLTETFALPTQQLIIWKGSPSDDVEKFLEPWKQFLPFIKVSYVTSSAHKEPVKSYAILQNLIQEIPDSVVIALIGRSNGAGPTLASNCTVPVLTVPMTWKEFENDVWSSLRTPSDCPVMTVLEPTNAILAAMQIFAMNNPAIYSMLRLKQETRLFNGLAIN